METWNLFRFLGRNRLPVMARRWREIRTIEPLKAKDLRGDVLEREISHFHWQTTKDLGSFPSVGILHLKNGWFGMICQGFLL